MTNSDSKTDPPPYSKIADSLSHSLNTPPSTGQARLVEGLSRARRDHLKGIICCKILPIIEQRAYLGLSHSEIALIPAKQDQHVDRVINLYSFEPTELETHDTPGFENIDNDDEIIQVQLTSPMDSPRFWNQKAIIVELRQLIIEMLREGDDSVSTSTGFESVSNENSSIAGSPQQIVPNTDMTSTLQKPSRLARLTRLIKSELDTTRRRDIHFEQSDIIDIKTDVQEICTRAVNDFGLYESMTKEVVVVNIQLRNIR